MKPRPLSPHLQIYRLPATALLSISHRITGALLTIGILFGIVLLTSLAFAPALFDVFREGTATVLGRTALWLWIYAFLFHLCHGLRHLLWDLGWSFQREHMSRNAGIELLASAALLLAVFAASLILS